MSMTEAQSHAREVRRRLINPPNAVIDRPIDLKQKIALVPDQPMSVMPVHIPPKAPVIHISDDYPIPSDLPGLIKEIRKLQRHLGRLSTECVKILVKLQHQGPRGYEIIDAVADHYGCARIDLISNRRTKATVEPRHVSMYLCRTLTTMSSPSVGRIFSDKDHTTILAATNKIAKLRKTDPHLDASITMLSERLTSCTPPDRTSTQP